MESRRETFDEVTHRTGPGYEHQYSELENENRGPIQNEYSDVDSVGERDIRRLSSNVANPYHESENTSESEDYAGMNQFDDRAPPKIHERKDGLGEDQLIGLTITSVAKHLASGDKDDETLWGAWLYAYSQVSSACNSSPWKCFLFHIMPFVCPF